jgi:hypothetical protein
MGARNGRTWVGTMTLWHCAFLGGVVAGTGIFLAAEVEVLRHIRHEVQHLNLVERFVGKVTFLWRGPDEKIALGLEQIPEAYLDHSETASRWLVGVGTVGIGIVLPLLFRPARRKG